MKSHAKFVFSISSQLVAMSKCNLLSGIRPYMRMHFDSCVVEFENGFSLSNFEKVVFGLADFVARKVPHVDFTCKAWLDDTDDKRCIELSVVYRNGVLRLTNKESCYMFRDGKICVDCGADLSDVLGMVPFMCQNCGATYAVAGADCDYDEIDHVFDGDLQSSSHEREYQICRNSVLYQ